MYILMFGDYFSSVFPLLCSCFLLLWLHLFLYWNVLCLPSCAIVCTLFVPVGSWENNTILSRVLYHVNIKKNRWKNIRLNRTETAAILAKPIQIDGALLMGLNSMSLVILVYWNIVLDFCKSSDIMGCSLQQIYYMLL